jgi:hypothetical protein
MGCYLGVGFRLVQPARPEQQVLPLPELERLEQQVLQVRPEPLELVLLVLQLLEPQQLELQAQALVQPS